MVGGMRVGGVTSSNRGRFKERSSSGSDDEKRQTEVDFDTKT